MKRLFFFLSCLLLMGCVHENRSSKIFPFHNLAGTWTFESIKVNGGNRLVTPDESMDFIFGKFGQFETVRDGKPVFISEVEDGIELLFSVRQKKELTLLVTAYREGASALFFSASINHLGSTLVELSDMRFRITGQPGMVKYSQINPYMKDVSYILRKTL